MSNYDEARAIMDLPGLHTKDLYKEQKLEKAAVLATLALADELRASREPKVETVYILRQYHPATDTDGLLLEAFKDRIKAYERRDEMNATSEALSGPVRYSIKEMHLR